MEMLGGEPQVNSCSLLFAVKLNSEQTERRRWMPPCHILMYTYVPLPIGATTCQVWSLLKRVENSH